VTRSGGAALPSEVWKYEYVTSGDNCGRLKRVTLSRGTNPPMLDLKRCNYEYYDSDESPKFGNVGDLKRVGLEIWDVLEEVWKSRPNDYQYFRYVLKGADTYCQGLLRCFVGGEAYHRMVEKGLDPLSAPDGEVQEYADLWLTYDFERKEDEPAAVWPRGIRELRRSGGGKVFRYGYGPRPTPVTIFVPEKYLFTR
jgi:hypothetical protein